MAQKVSAVQKNGISDSKILKNLGKLYKSQKGKWGVGVNWDKRHVKQSVQPVILVFEKLVSSCHVRRTAVDQ